MFCNTCGAQIDDNVAFCTQCGAPVQNEASPVFEPMDDHPTELFNEEPVYEAVPVQETYSYESAPAFDTAPVYEAAPDESIPPYQSAFETATTDTAVSPKSRTATLILSIALGELGINRFYLGAKGGVLRLILFIIAAICSVFWFLCFIAIPIYILLTVWTVKDIIRAAKGTMLDGDGLPVTKW